MGRQLLGDQTALIDHDLAFGLFQNIFTIPCGRTGFQIVCGFSLAS